MAYTNIDDPSAYFQVKKWTGNASTNAITLDGNTDMQPDFMWHKEQNDTNGWHQFDSSRGVTKYLASQNTAAEGTFGGYLSSFDSNGFTAGSGDSSMNSSGTAQCSWMWHCNAGTTVSNTDGNVTNTLQVNQDAGFSISKFTSIISGNTTIGHGLGVTPDVFIVKIASGTGGWWVNHKGLTNQSDRYVGLHSTQAETTFSWGAAPTSTLITAAPAFIGNGTTTVICYAFAEKQGYSKFGSYVGNGNSNGPFVYTGFRPAFVMVKNASASESWVIYDTTRNLYNVADLKLSPDTGDSENGNAGIGGAIYNNIDILSNGFKCRTNNAATNGSGNTIIYMAFAENPFTTSTGIPTTAR